jgi:hypothetical protein
MEALYWFHQMARLWIVFVIFCPQDRLQLGPVVAYYQFVQGGPICCCFRQAAAVWPYAATLSGQLLPQQGGPIQFWILPSVPWDKLNGLPHLQFGRLPTLAPSLCSSPYLPMLRVQVFAPPSFSEVGSVLHPIPTVCGRLEFTVCASQFCSGEC